MKNVVSDSSAPQDVVVANGHSGHPAAAADVVRTSLERTISEMEEDTIMSAQDVSYWATSGCFRKQKKQILHNVTCFYKKGVNIILGPTGSGKTTLLDILAYRKNPTQMTGTVLLNGRPRSSSFKNRVGYVTQDDIMMSTLTVRENISFSAALRLPTRLSHAVKEARVDEVITMLGLDKCANTKIGDDIIRGVSGGERKRCNIGMEMIISPPVLFLDEPTTGLDARTAYSVIKLLKNMAQRGKVIILSIHQPRYSIYGLADTTTMLTAGRLLYHGPPQEAVEFFSAQGFVCAPFNNPADFFLDTLGEDTLGDDGKSNADRLTECFKTSKWQDAIDAEMREVAAMGGANMTGVFVRDMLPNCANDSGGYATSWLHQFSVVCRRGLKDVVKNPQITLAMVVKSVILSLFVGSLFWQLGSDTERAITQDRTGVIFFLQLIQQFVNISAVNVFICERRLFRHEISNGYYRTSAYFVAKVFCDLLPLRLLPVAILTFSTQFAVGLRMGGDHIFLLFAAMYAICVATACLAFFVGCTVTENESGHIAMSMMIAVSNLYAGFLLNFSSIPAALSWIQHLSIAKYGFKIMMINEFADRNFTITGTNMTLSGNEYLSSLDIDEHYTTWDIVPNFIALIIYGGIMLLLATIQLARTKVHS